MSYARSPRLQSEGDGLRLKRCEAPGTYYRHGCRSCASVHSDRVPTYGLCSRGCRGTFPASSTATVETRPALSPPVRKQQERPQSTRRPRVPTPTSCSRRCRKGPGAAAGRGLIPPHAIALQLQRARVIERRQSARLVPPVEKGQGGLGVCYSLG